MRPLIKLAAIAAFPADVCWKSLWFSTVDAVDNVDNVDDVDASFVVVGSFAVTVERKLVSKVETSKVNDMIGLDVEGELAADVAEAALVSARVALEVSTVVGVEDTNEVLAGSAHE